MILSTITYTSVLCSQLGVWLDSGPVNGAQGCEGPLVLLNFFRVFPHLGFVYLFHHLKVKQTKKVFLICLNRAIYSILKLIILYNICIPLFTLLGSVGYIRVSNIVRYGCTSALLGGLRWLEPTDQVP